MKKVIVVLLILLVTGCSNRVQTDSGMDYSSANKTDDTVYDVVAVMVDIQSYYSGSTFGGTSVGDFYQSSSYWSETSGKGATLVYIESVNPRPDGMGLTDGFVVVKTTDRKIMAVPAGFRMHLKCRMDWEPIAAVESGQKLTDDAVTWELDYCRMTTGRIEPVESTE